MGIRKGIHENMNIISGTLYCCMGHQKMRYHCSFIVEGLDKHCVKKKKIGGGQKTMKPYPSTPFVL